MTFIARSIELCDRHDEEFVPDPVEGGCALSEELNCEGARHLYVPAELLQGAVDELRKVRKVLGAVKFTDLQEVGYAVTLAHEYAASWLDNHDAGGKE